MQELKDKFLRDDIKEYKPKYKLYLPLLEVEVFTPTKVNLPQTKSKKEV